MIAARNFRHNGVRFLKGRKVELPEGDIAVLESLGFIHEPPRKSPAAKPAE